VILIISFGKSIKKITFATTFHKLTGISTYKAIIAALLLGLYAFIVTPVQLWHQHSYETGPASEQTSTEKHSKTVSTSTGNIAEANCQLCTHHYSIYLDVVAERLEIPFNAFQSHEQYFIFSIPSSPLLHFTNKGPPALS
jgi:hypothetical protein